MRKRCTTPLSGTGGAFTIIPVRPERSGTKSPVHPERSGAKSKDALSVLATVLATVLMVAALAGCGGGGKTAAPLMPVTGLPDNLTLTGDSFTIRAGESRRVGDADGVRTELRCPADGPDCDVTVGADGAARYTGGRPEVVTVSYTTIQLPEGELMLTEDTTIPAGESRILQQTFDTRTELRCPADGEDCMVTLTEDGTAESTGGRPTVVTYTTLYLPSGHTLAEGTTIPAGERRTISNFRGRSHSLVCPFDGEACEVRLGEFDFESTGGAPYVETTTNQMVWQANNGPDGTSDGAHARGLEGRLVRGSSLNMTNPILGSGTVQSPRRIADMLVSNTRNMATESFRTVTQIVSWASSDAAPTLRLSVSGTGSDTFSVEGDSDLPSLGTGWNGAALSKTGPAGRTARAVLYSDITQQPDGGSADAFYMTLGAWLVTPDDPAAASTQYDLGVFARGSTGRINHSTIRSLAGRATYQGPATGLYSAATYSDSSGSRALESATVGSFTATATINADFGVSGNFGGFGGTVTNFRENGESLGNWTVDLGQVTINQGTGFFYGGIGGGQAGSRSLSTGNWAVEFYRNSGSGHPDLATGTFSASTLGPADDALHIVGAFVAERQ